METKSEGHQGNDPICDENGEIPPKATVTEETTVEESGVEEAGAAEEVGVALGTGESESESESDDDVGRSL
jgi:hypothetical protein